MYSLICRHAKVSLIPNNQPEDTELSNYKLDTPSSELKRSQAIKKKLETSRLAQYVLFVITITGTSMVIGDGVLTPCISGNRSIIKLIFFGVQQTNSDYFDRV